MIRIHMTEAWRQLGDKAAPLLQVGKGWGGLCFVLGRGGGGGGEGNGGGGGAGGKLFVCCVFLVGIGDVCVFCFLAFLEKHPPPLWLPVKNTLHKEVT